jgi:hypothetical protein
MLIQTFAAVWLTAAAATPRQPPPQPYHAPGARRHFLTVTFDQQFVQPYSFDKHPLPDLLGQEVDEVHLASYQYRSHDGLTLVNVLEYGKRATGIGATVYPFGSSEGLTLALRGSLETIPTIRVAFTGPAPAPSYDLTNGRAVDVGIGIDMSDRSPGWGLGSHSFVIGGIGRIQADQRSGTRYFAEAGGGVTSGPFGVDVSIKFSVNRFGDPVANRLYLIPVSVRGTLSF